MEAQEGYVKVSYFALQVTALRAKREQELEELKNERSNFPGVSMDRHLRKNVDTYFDSIRTTRPTATLRQIEGVRNGMQQLVRPLLLKH